MNFSQGCVVTCERDHVNSSSRITLLRQCQVLVLLSMCFGLKRLVFYINDATDFTPQLLLKAKNVKLEQIFFHVKLSYDCCVEFE